MGGFDLLMSARRTPDVDILVGVVLLYALRDWSSLIGLEADSCMTLIAFYILLLSR